MAKKASKAWVLVLGVIIVVALFTVPPALKAGKDAWDKAWKDFWSIFERTSNDTDTEGTGSGKFGITIYYEDGTNTEFEGLSIIPLRISDGADSPITKITLQLKVLIRYVGVMSQYEITSHYAGDLVKDTATISTPFSEDISKVGTSLANGAITNVWTKDITSANIETLGLTDGSSYTLDFKLTEPVTVTTKYTGGTTETQTLTSNDTVSWTFSYSKSEGITSLTVAFSGVTS